MTNDHLSVKGCIPFTQIKAELISVGITDANNFFKGGWVT